MEEKAAVSFGFAKKVETKKLSKSAVSEGTDDGKTVTDFVLSLEGNEVKGTAPKVKEKGLYVIPLIKQNKWRSGAEKRLSDVKKEYDPNDLDQQAAKEVLEETARYNENWEERDKPDPNLAIPLLMQNKIPDGFETEEKLDVALRPEAPDDADYEQIPIEQFGLAMLRGMGWKEGQGLGKNGKVIAPVEAHLRPKGLGLGADRSQAAGDKVKKAGSKGGDDEEELVMKKGAFCVVLNGKHKDLFGVIEGIDEDNARLVIKLTLSGQTVTLTQYNVKLVGKKEYDKYSKYLNKGKADKYSTDKQQNGHESKTNKNENSNLDRDRKHDDEEENSHGTKKHKGGDRENNYKRKNRSEDVGGLDRQSKQSRSSEQDRVNLWLRKDMRVRVVDKHYKKGKHYKEKVVVVDVVSIDNTVCKTVNGKVIDGLSLSQLETVIPKQDDAYVVLCSGKYRGQLAKIIKKKKDLCQALVQVLSDRDRVLEVGFDDICEYVGVIDDAFDY